MSEEVTLALVGDLMLGRLINAALSKHGLRHVWGNVQPLLSGGLGKNQLVAGNLECAITLSNDANEKESTFKLTPANARVLRVAGVEYVSLANNHILDYKVPGLLETQKVLSEAGIAFSGAGTKREASQPVYIKKAEYKFAIFSFADHYDYWAATDKVPSQSFQYLERVFKEAGINFINPSDYNLNEFKKQVKYAKEEKGAEFVIVSIHWGPNFAWNPSVDICTLAHDFVEAGVDLIVGHSAHHIQGIEIFKGVPIIYGAGGFIDDFAVDKVYRNDLGFIFTVRISKRDIKRIDLVPVKIDHIPGNPGDDPPSVSKVNRAVGEDYAWLVKKMSQLCRFFGTKIEDKGEEKGMSIEMEPHLIKIKKKNTPKQFSA